MSSGQKLNRADTAYAEKAIIAEEQKWVRHGIDEMLFDGATVEQLAKGAKTTKATVYVHLTHLRKVHKRVVVKKEGVFRYDVDKMHEKNGKKSKKKNS